MILNTTSCGAYGGVTSAITIDGKMETIVSLTYTDSKDVSTEKSNEETPVSMLVFGPNWVINYLAEYHKGDCYSTGTANTPMFCDTRYEGRKYFRISGATAKDMVAHTDAVFDNYQTECIND